MQLSNSKPFDIIANNVRSRLGYYNCYRNASGRTGKVMKEYTYFNTLVTMLDIMSDSPMDEKSLLKKAGINASTYAKYSTLLIELGLAQETEIITLSESSITDSLLEITQKGKDFLSCYFDLIELDM